MSLRTLLPISRSFEPGADRAGRYRPQDAGVVPDFSVRPEVARVPAAVAVAEATPVEPTMSKSPFTPVGCPTGAGQAGRLAARREAGHRLPLWLEQLLLALMRPGNRRRGTRPRPVQTELAFQRVAVARNDLMTADVEVVPVRPPGRAAGLSAACRSRLLKLWWEQGADRLKRLGGVLH